jgi:hypothetical protein
LASDSGHEDRGSKPTVDEIRALQRHSTRTAALHYVHPDDRTGGF